MTRSTLHRSAEKAISEAPAAMSEKSEVRGLAAHHINHAQDLANHLRVLFNTVDADDLQALPASDVSYWIGLCSGLAMDLCDALDGGRS